MSLKVSIFTPSYNKASFVSQAINSVLSQTYGNFDYLVLDNSTDGKTREYVKSLVFSLGDSRISYAEEDFTEEERKDFYITAVLFNRVFDLMEGDLITYISDDDLWSPWYLEKFIEVFENPDVRVAYSYLWIYDQDESLPYKWRKWLRVPRFEPCKILKGNDLHCQLDGGQVVFRKECLAEIEKPYYPESGVWEVKNFSDGTFLTKLNEKFEFYPVPFETVIHRRTWISAFGKPDGYYE